MAYVASTKGYRDFIIQRVSAIYMTIYIIVAFTMVFICNNFTFEYLQQAFKIMSVRIATLLFIISLLMHSWIGMWTIATDYINNSLLRNSYFVLIIAMSLFYLFWATEIIWGFK